MVVQAGRIHWFSFMAEVSIDCKHFIHFLSEVLCQRADFFFVLLLLSYILLSFYLCLLRPMHYVTCKVVKYVSKGR